MLLGDPDADGALGPRGCTPPEMFRPGYDINSLLLETCANTTSSSPTIKADDAQGWLFLHLVNAGATTKLSVSLDAHTMFVYAADGLFVEMQEVKVGDTTAVTAFPRTDSVRYSRYRSVNGTRS